jgi:hypothetical protein
MAGTIFVVVVLARFLLPLLIPRFPLPAIIACLVLDAADQTIFQMFTDDPLLGYQSYDKALDVYYLAIAYMSTMRNWTDPFAFQTARFLYLYRLVGVTLFEMLDKRWMLLVFANTFEYFFIAYEAVRVKWNPLRLSHKAVIRIAAFIWIFIKLPQEYWIHIAKLDFTDFMDNYPFMYGVFGGLAIIVGGIGWSQRSHIPASDWAFTVDVDRNLPKRAIDVKGRAPFWSDVLLEKVVLLALISLIFAQIVPGVEISTLGLLFGISAGVVLNAAVTEWLHRRGQTWATTFGQFAAMLAINVGIVFVDSVFGSRRPGNWPSLPALFFALLLAVLIAMFDRFRATKPVDQIATATE